MLCRNRFISLQSVWEEPIEIGFEHVQYDDDFEFVSVFLQTSLPRIEGASQLKEALKRRVQTLHNMAIAV